MVRVKTLRWIPLLLAASGCAKSPPPQVPSGTSVTIASDESLMNDWKSLILPDDNARLTAIETAWSSALVDARARRFDKAISAEGPLLDPKGAETRPAPPPGRYRCRIFKLGVSASGKGTGFAKFKPFYCFIGTDDKLLTFTKSTGTRRPGGRLWDDGETRMVFLGGVAEGRAATPAYGADPRQNSVGIFERVGDFRWRLVTPDQSPDARIEVMELVPDTPPPTEQAQ